MTESQFNELLTEHMLPLLAGTKLGGRHSSSPRHALVAYKNPCSLVMKPAVDAGYRTELVRSQAFKTEERELVGHFIDELSKVVQHASLSQFRDLMAVIPRRVICRLLSGDRGRAALEEAIQSFESLASQTYEGRPVVAALGVTGSMGHGQIKLEELWREDFARVLSNGFDSMYLCGSDGRVFNMAYLPAAESPQFAPHRLGAIAAWCNSGQRVAVVLNRNGEILVFKDQRLQFAKRRGAWRYYAHDSVVQRLGVGKASLRSAVYESCLDVSFARSGGCIAVLSAAGHGELHKVLNDSDLIVNEQQARTKLLAHAVKRPFQSLDRRMRLELLSMDGATIVSHTGEVVAAGAIIKVPGGSTGGGRRAAATQLSTLGLAIKISADGPMTGFRNRKEIFSL
ncbi:MAG: hypothetical protein AB7H96_24230 [Vicinamibacterales bacterium]